MVDATKKLLITAFCVCQHLVALASPFADSKDWYLESNMLSLDASNRFVSTIAATNPSSSPLYIRATVTQVALKDGKRIRQEDAAGVLKISPAEFIIRPRETFRVRLLADPGKLDGASSSYYVKFEDMSQLRPAGDKHSGLAAGYTLAYEALINVNKESLSSLTEKEFNLFKSTSGKLGLTNASKQHIYLDRGNACPDNKTLPVDCDVIPGFPKQTLLPGETVFFEASARPVLVVIAQPGLNLRSRPSRVYLPLPQ